MAQLRIVIIGAGFVGLPAARHFRKRLPSAEITLIDRKDHFLFTPRLIDLLEREKMGTEFTANLPAVAKRDGFRFLQGAATMVHREEKMVDVKTEDGKTETLPYDAIVLCQGAKPTYFKIPGAETYGLPLKTREDIEAIHAKVAECFTAAASADPMKAKGLLSFVVVGAGPSGIEALFSLKSYAERYAEKNAPTLKQHLSFAVAQAAPQILPGFLPKIVEHAKNALSRHNVDILEGDPVAKVEEDALTTAVGRRIPFGLLLWCAGIEANSVGMAPETLLDRGGCLMTDRFLRVADHVFAAGDTIVFMDRNVTIPKNAQTAMLMSQTIVENVARTFEKRPLQTFSYHSKGNMLTLGPNDGVLQAGSFVFRTGLARPLRDLFYRYRERQVTGN
jgi:NADH dehydrogenase